MAGLKQTKIGALAYALRALGRDEPPATFVLDGRTYSRTAVVKHDFWAATAFYADASGTMAVVKLSRAAPFFGFGLAWIGGWLCRREMRFYAALHDLPSIPRLIGRLGPTGFVHEFGEGRPLHRRERTPDRFFPELQRLFEELHRRGIAYVDANKRENILITPDDRPLLIDFQISYDLRTLGNFPANRALMRWLQAADDYHVLKHKQKMRPDQLSPGEVYRLARHARWIGLHRFITRPYFLIRRASMKRLQANGLVVRESTVDC